MKKFLTLIGLGFIFVFAFTGINSYATDNTKILNDGGFDIDNKGELVYSVKDKTTGETVADFEYDNNGLRTYKKGMTECYFTYEDGYLSGEVRDGIEISYHMEYIPIGDFDQLTYTWFAVEGKRYYYTFEYEENSAIIAGIEDEAGNPIAKYEYADSENVKLEAVYEITPDGNWQLNTDRNFIGNYNHIINAYCYLDEETGWLYCFPSGVYCSDEGVVGLYIYDTPISETNPYKNNEAENAELNETISLPEEEISAASVYESTDLEVEEWAESLLSNASYNAEKPSNYYQTAAIVEILSRTLYGECASNLIDQRAVSYVFMNRKRNSHFPNTYFQMYVLQVIR